MERPTCQCHLSTISLSHLHTRSQAIARIADHTAWQHTIAIVAEYHLQQFWRYCALSVLGHEFDLLGSRDVIGHVIIWYPICHFLLVVLWNAASIINVLCNAIIDMTLIRPLNKGEGHSFWYQSISHITTSYRLSIVTFALGRTV